MNILFKQERYSLLLRKVLHKNLAADIDIVYAIKSNVYFVDRIKNSPCSCLGEITWQPVVHLKRNELV